MRLYGTAVFGQYHDIRRLKGREMVTSLLPADQIYNIIYTYYMIKPLMAFAYFYVIYACTHILYTD